MGAHDPLLLVGPLVQGRVLAVHTTDLRAAALAGRGWICGAALPSARPRACVLSGCAESGCGEPGSLSPNVTVVARVQGRVLAVHTTAFDIVLAS